MNEGNEMSTAIATTNDPYTPDKVDLIRRTICKDATNVELELFLHQCRRTGLDPFARQIHAVKRWDSSQGREVMAIQTGIDGFRLIAERTGKYAGNDDPQYDSEDGPNPKKATVTVWKIVEGQRVPFTRSARWMEFVQTKKDGSPTRFWAKMPYLMLGKVAEALALRAAFPQELSGLYTHEEMGQADSGETARQIQTPDPLHAAPAIEASVNGAVKRHESSNGIPADRDGIEQQVFDCMHDMANMRGKPFDDAYWAVMRGMKIDYASLADIPYGILCRVRDEVAGKVESMRREMAAV